MARPDPSPQPRRDPEWIRRATRWTQLTFVENDPLHFDQEFWVDVMRRSRSNALCLSAGGYIAYYPTKIDFHHRSVHLGDTDPFGDLVEQARRLGMQVMARVDPHAIHEDAARAHPEWLARRPDGSPIEHWAFPGIWLTDPFSSYHREFITEVAREIVTDYDVDAVFANRWEGYGGVSYAEDTARRFRDDTGHELPRQDRREDPAWEAYGRWRSRQLSELVVRWDDAVRAVRPHARFIPNRGSMLTRDLVRELVDDRYPMFVIDKQGRSRTEPIWTPGRAAKRSRGMFPERPVNVLTSVGPEYGEHRWKDSVDSPAELQVWIADAFIHGGQPWFTKFNATVSDDRWVRPIVDSFRTHERLEPYLTELPVRHQVAILDNVRLDPADLGAAHGTATPDEDGFYQALLETRIGFDYLADDELGPERLADYRVLVLPDARALSDDHVEQLRKYVADGGSIVAAHGSAQALADLLGVSDVAEPRRPVKNNYIAIDHDHRLTAGFDGAQRIIGGTSLVGVAAAEGDGVTVPFRFFPDFPDLPMEEVYPRAAPDAPAVVCREHPGGGRTCCLAFNVGEIFWEALQADHGQLIGNAVRWALGEEPAVSITGNGLIDFAVRSDPSRTTIAVVNLTNPMTMRGQFREVIPLSEQEVSVAVPDGTGGVRARAVVSDTELDIQIVDGRARFRLPKIDVVELVELVWS